MNELLRETTHQRRMLLLDCGHMVLTPGEVEKGDVVCVFLCAEQPCVVRSAGADEWKLISGQCLIALNMGGQAFTPHRLTAENITAPIAQHPLVDFKII